MNVLVCVKRVPAPGTRINVTADGLAVDTSFLGFTTSPHEECAVEAAVQLVEQHGGRSTVLTVGPPEAEEQLRYAVSVGIDDAVLVPTDGADWDPQRTARAIVDGDRRAGDGRRRSISSCSATSRPTPAASRSASASPAPSIGRSSTAPRRCPLADGAVRVERETDAGRVVFALPVPAVVGVKEGINLPRYPTMKGRWRRRRLPSRRSSRPPRSWWAAAGCRCSHRPSRPATPSSSGEGPDAAPAVVDLLAEIGVLQ